MKVVVMGETDLEIVLQSHEQHYSSNYLLLGLVLSVPSILSYCCGTGRYKPNFYSPVTSVVLPSVDTLKIMAF